MNAAVSLLANATLFELSPAHVDCRDRIGFLHEDKAAALGRLMAVDGQRDPIKVVAQPDNPDLPWRLVTGMHRLMGAIYECIPVFAIEVAGTSDELAELEASENLHRRPLAPIERAKFVQALCEAAKARIARESGGVKQQVAAIEARWAKVRREQDGADQVLKDEVHDTLGHVGTAYGWQESVGDALGYGGRTIARSLRLYRLIIEPFPDLAEALSGHPIVGENDKQLRDIADIKDEAARRQVIEALIADPDLSADLAKSNAGIGLALPGVAPIAHQKFYDQISSGWTRLGLTQKRAFLPEIVTMLETHDMKSRLFALLRAELGE